jgi:hypothetical protein
MESAWTEVNCYLRHDATRYDGGFRYYDSHPQHQGTGLKTTILAVHGVGYNSGSSPFLLLFFSLV